MGISISVSGWCLLLGRKVGGEYHLGESQRASVIFINVSFPRLGGGCLFSYSLYLFVCIYNIKSNEMPQKIA